MAIGDDSGKYGQFIPKESLQGRRPEEDFGLGEGYQAGSGNNPRKVSLIGFFQMH